MAVSWIHSALGMGGGGSDSSGRGSPRGSSTALSVPLSLSGGSPPSGVPEPHVKVRIAIVGDTSTGKSTLLQFLTSTDAHIHASLGGSGGGTGGGGKGGDARGVVSTSTFTGIHHHGATGKAYWIELVTLPRGHLGAGARAVLFASINGIIGVHDLSVPRTLDAMWKHVNHVLDAQDGATILKPASTAAAPRSGRTAVPMSPTDWAPPYSNGIPVLIVGTKSDLVPGLFTSASSGGDLGSGAPTHARSASILEVTGNELVMSMYSPPSSDAFAGFFNQVISARQAQSATSYSYGYPPPVPPPLSPTSPLGPSLSYTSLTGTLAAAATPYHGGYGTPLLGSVHAATAPAPRLSRSATSVFAGIPGVGASSSTGDLSAARLDPNLSPRIASPRLPIASSNQRRRMVVMGGASPQTTLDVPSPSSGRTRGHAREPSLDADG
ncbi:hypothetical protein H9P43_007554 [Blastocladiella emersonii ATCC 22665]|nr:hypothetical protein H9P43_007554 [Blastocladiella emersonii ATCC 22665]